MQPFDSWKKSPPASPEEARTAQLLQQVGDAEQLSPAAAARVERRLRAAAEPRSLFSSGFWLGAVAVSGLAMIFAMVATIRVMDARIASTASTASADRTLALNDVPPPPSVAPEPAEPREPSGEQADKADERMAPKPTGHPAEEAPGKENNASRRALRKSIPSSGLLAGLEKSEQSEPQVEQLQPMALDAKKVRPQVADGLAGAGAVRPVPAGAPEAFDSAELAAAPPAAGPPPRLAAKSRSVVAATADVGSDEPRVQPGDAASCQAALPGFSTSIARNSGDVEQAYIGRARCRLLLGQRQAGLADLRVYLMRFPEGRFAARATAMLQSADPH